MKKCTLMGSQRRKSIEDNPIEMKDKGEVSAFVFFHRR